MAFAQVLSLREARRNMHLMQLLPLMRPLSRAQSLAPDYLVS